jgi:parallel beta helix pectate lyase-like protein/flagellar hook capping protein FlgD
VAHARIGPVSTRPSREASRLRMLARGVVAAVLCAGLRFHPAVASTAVVPDDFPTVHQGIDSGADTVLIREGTYPERPVIDRPLVLEGIGSDQRPRLAGLQIYNTNFWLAPATLSIARVNFTGAVGYTTLYYRPRQLTLLFSQCGIDRGIQIDNQDADDILLLSLRNCRIAASSRGQIAQVYMEADTVDGGVAWRSSYAGIQNCWFRGGPHRAIELTGYARGGAIARNRIEGYATGIYAEDIEGYDVMENGIFGCGKGIELNHVYEMTAESNDVRDCVAGLEASACNGLKVVGNRILRASQTGVRAYIVTGLWGLVVKGNVVGWCGGDGLSIEGSEGTLVEGNTLLKNGASGIVVGGAPGYPMTIRANIGVGNAGWGLVVAGGEYFEGGCNDWFGNGLGAISGGQLDSTDAAVDPLFCNVDSADVRLDSRSPLLAAAACGEIGALGVGCGATATLVQRFAAGWVSDGVRVVWQVATGATASGIWVERAEGLNGQAWTQPVMERSIEGATVVELDRSALAGQTYRYRLVARDGGVVTILDPGIVVEAQMRLSFALGQVGPSPSAGPLRIAFTLAHNAEIEIDVYDVQGRRVASPARGEWPAGAQVVQWDGRARDGQLAAAGLYMIRYRYPGGQDRRGIVRVR